MVILKCGFAGGFPRIGLLSEGDNSRKNINISKKAFNGRNGISNQRFNTLTNTSLFSE